MADIFVSYASEDRERVVALVDLLVAAGFSVWWDRELKGGSVFSKEIEAEIEAASVLLAVWTESSIRSHWVTDEVDVGRIAGKLLPIALDAVVPPIGFRQIQTIDFSDWAGAGEEPVFEALVDALGGYVGGDDGKEAETVAVSASPAAEATIAVLPFVNMSADPEQEFFSDGLSEELLNLLAKVEGLRVAARTSSFQFKNQNVNVARIGEELGVAYILEGSVRKAGNRVRITGQLIEAAEGFHLWSETFDRDLDDIFAIQDEISRAIVEALKKVVLGDVEMPHTERTDSVEAYELYLLAVQAEAKSGVANLKKSMEYLERTLALDPDYAPAHADLATAHILLSNDVGCLGVTTVAEARERAWPHVEKALALAPDLPMAHAASAAYYRLTRQFDKALEAIDKALELNPNLMDAYHCLTFVKLLQADPWFDMLALQKKLIEIDPLNTTALGNYSTHLVEYGKFDEAEAIVNKIWQYTPGNVNAVFRRAEIAELQFELAQTLKIAIDHPEPVKEAPALIGYMIAPYALGLGPVVEHFDKRLAATNYITLGDRLGLKRTARAMRAAPERHDNYRCDLCLAFFDTLEGKFEEALAVLSVHDEDDPEKWGQHFGSEEVLLGAQLAIFLRLKTGDQAGADFYISKLEEAYAAREAHPEGMVHYGYICGAAVALFKGDKGLALERVALQAENSLFGSIGFKGLPWFRALDGEPEFDAVLATIDRRIDGEREKAEEMGLLPLSASVESFWGGLTSPLDSKI